MRDAPRRCEQQLTHVAIRMQSGLARVRQANYGRFISTAAIISRGESAANITNETPVMHSSKALLYINLSLHS